MKARRNSNMARKCVYNSGISYIATRRNEHFAVFCVFLIELFEVLCLSSLCNL